MNTSEEIINGHECKFEISGDNNQFTGMAEIKNPCLSRKFFFTPEETIFPTGNAAKAYLENEIKEFLTAPLYTHPLVDSKPQSIGTRCSSCKGIISSNDGWKGVSL